MTFPVFAKANFSCVDQKYRNGILMFIDEFNAIQLSSVYISCQCHKYLPFTSDLSVFDKNAYTIIEQDSSDFFDVELELKDIHIMHKNFTNLVEIMNKFGYDVSQEYKFKVY